jgi:condensin complex subunit 3
VAQVRVQLNELKDELEQAIKDQNFVVAQDIQKSMADLEEKLKSLTNRPAQYDVEVFREERNDPLTLLKCLSVVCELLKNAQVMKYILPSLALLHS